MEETLTKKTWSRELATVMVLFLGVLAYQEKESLDALVWPTIVFATAAFGLKHEVVKEYVNGRQK